MPARNPESAVGQLLARTRTIVGCLTNRPVIAPRRGQLGGLRTLAFAPGDEPVRLRSDDGRRQVFLTMRIEFEVIATQQPEGEFEAAIRSYWYRLLDRDDVELLVWHWHPLGRSEVTHPHLHLSSRVPPLELGRGLASLPLADLHVPTGHVELSDIVRFLLAEVGVSPRRSDWQAVLDAARVADETSAP